VIPVDQKRIENIYLDTSRTSSGAGLRVFIFYARIPIAVMEHAKVFAGCGIYIATLWKFVAG
jgi:hypothetical protein